MSAPQFTPLDEPMPGAIRPEMLAKKIADVRRLKLPELAKYCEAHPRAIEALWFIQWMSMQPGGLAKLSADLIAFLGVRLGTESMRRFGQRKYTRAECKQVWGEIPIGKRGELEEESDDSDAFIFCDDHRDRMERERRIREMEEHNRNVERLTYERNEPYFRELALESAEAELVLFFEKLCAGSGESVARWYCPDVLAEVLAFADARAELVRQRLAQTAVAEKVFDTLDYASAERVLVRIEGESRFGKTECIDTYAAMFPGKVRVVRTPSSNSERDLIRAVAEAFGIHQTFGTRGETLKDKVEFVIRFSGVLLCFDEGAFLVPSSFTATTPPARLNWIRCAIIDRKIPCAIVVTPQSYNSALARFVKKTSYTFEQFLGREALRVSLPNELAHEDLLAVARIHFPEADEDLLGLIAAKAMQSESYLKAVENIARRARYISKKRGAKRLSLADVDKAIAEVMPAPLAPAPAVAAVTQAAPPKASRSRAAKQPRKRGSAAATVLQAPFRPSKERFNDRETELPSDSERAAGALATA
jgi:hypothetical protein